MNNIVDEKQPEIFISHRTKDKHIAKTICDFITKATGGFVRVFYSSDDSRNGMVFGNALKQELAERLNSCSVLILLYTRSDDDWTYCIWECGVAFDPKHVINQDACVTTKTIVFQFTSEPPRPLRDGLCVDARNVSAVLQFVRQLLTDKNFFPGLGRKVTNFNESDQIINDYGKELHENLVIHQQSWESAHKSAIWPRMLLELDLHYGEQVRGADNDARETISSNIIVRESDAEARGLFGLTSTHQKTLRDLFDEWRERKSNPGSSDEWAKFLVTQIIDVIMGRRVEPNWKLLHIKSKGSFLPIVLSCSTLPFEQKYQIELCFLEFLQTLQVTNQNSDRELRANYIVSPISPVLGEKFLEPLTNTNFIWIEGGRFLMGSEQIEPDAHASPCHHVQISSFWLAQTPVTRKQYQIYLMETPEAKQPNYWLDGRFSEEMQPAVGISWDDAMSFTNWLSKRTGLNMRLPSEAQWEFAARGTNGNMYPWGDAPPNDRLACYGRDERNGKPCLVGSFKEGQSPFGLLDQSGNVWEWCCDEWDESAYETRTEDEIDPIVQNKSSSWRVLRGGGWDLKGEEIKYLIPAYRMGNIKGVQHWAHGFRLAVIPEKAQ